MSEPEVSAAENDPAVPFDKLPEERPGTAASVKAEMEGVSRYVNIDDLKKANKLKNQGVRFALPRHTLPGVVLRMRPLNSSIMAVAQGQHQTEVRQSLGLKTRQSLPHEGQIELNSRLIKSSLLEWCEGEADIEGAVRAAKLKNSGVRFAFPRNVFPGVVIRVRPLSHPYIGLVRSEVVKRLKNSLGGGELPPEAEIEVNRSIVEASILEWVAGDVKVGGSNFNLIGRSRTEVRAWFRANFFPAPDLRERPPRNEDERNAYFEAMFADLNNDMLEEVLRSHEMIRTADPQEILARGEGFTVGADWDYEGDARYEPGEMVSWKGKEPKELRRLFGESFLPPVDLKSRAPRAPEEREKHYEQAFAPFNNEILNELLEGQDMIRAADPEDVLEKGSAFTVGAQDSTDSNG